MLQKAFKITLNDPTRPWQSELDFFLHLKLYAFRWARPGSNDFKIDHDLIQIYTEMDTHVSINAQKLCCKRLTIAGFLSTLRPT